MARRIGIFGFIFFLTVWGSWGDSNRFFRVGQTDGTWHLITPEGKPFISLGVDVVVPQDPTAKKGQLRFDALKNNANVEAWAKAAVEQLKSWNFNTVGAWSDASTFTKGMPYTVYLNLAASAQHRLVDVWSASFVRKAAAVAAKLSGYRNDPLLIGYFLENEQPWYGDVSWGTGHASTLLDLYLKLPISEPGRKVVQSFLEGRYASFSEFSQVWATSAKTWKELEGQSRIQGNSRKSEEDRTAFAAVVAQMWYKTVVQAVKAVDPNHLILGDRFAARMPAGVVEACGQWCDIVSVNHYKKSGEADADLLGDYWLQGRKPVLITEFSYRAMENRSGDQNSLGADVTVATQADRAAKYKQYVSIVARLPWVVGWHWFQYFDEPPGGRSFDGENSNYGLLDIEGRAYEPLVQAMRETNAQAAKVHFENKAPYPSRVTGGDVYVRWNAPSASVQPRPWISAFNGQDWNAWADTSEGGKVTAKSGVPLILRYDTGQGWGGGISFRSDSAKKNPDGSADISAYRGIRFVLQAPRGLQFQFFVAESGVQDPGKDKYSGWGGADGESTTTTVFEGTGEVKEYRIEFQELQIRNTWGNQKGNKTLDTQAVAQVDLSLLGKQGSGEIAIQKIELY